MTKDGFQPSIFAVFEDRVRRQLREVLQTYRDELRAISNEMAARRLHNSGLHLTRRLKAFGKWMQMAADRCFLEARNLPGQESIDREVHLPLLSTELRQFFQQAESDVAIRGISDAAAKEVERQIQTVREGLESDLRDFRAGLWVPRNQPVGQTVTNNTVNIRGSSVGSVQQAGDNAVQVAYGQFNAADVTEALEAFAEGVAAAGLPTEIRTAIELEIASVRPQLKKAIPNTSIIREGLLSIKSIVEGAAGSVLGQLLLNLMHAAGF